MIIIKKYCILLFILLISAAGYAAERVEGTILYPDKAVKVTLLIPTGLFGGGPDVQAMQRGIRYLDENGKKKKLKPSQAQAFTFNYKGHDFTMVSHDYSSGLFGRSVFMLLVIDGRAKMYEYTVTNSRGGGPNMPMSTTTTTHTLIQLPGQPLYEPTLIGFKKRMAEYFRDCPELAGLIAQKELRRRDLDEIVIYYNDKCR